MVLVPWGLGVRLQITMHVSGVVALGVVVLDEYLASIAGTSRVVWLSLMVARRAFALQILLIAVEVGSSACGRHASFQLRRGGLVGMLTDPENSEINVLDTRR